LILAKPTQRQIHTRPSKAETFSFAVARHEGNFSQYTRLIVGLIQRESISVRPHTILGQLYPTRRKTVWSILLSLKEPEAGNFTLGQLEISEASRRGTEGVEGIAKSTWGGIAEVKVPRYPAFTLPPR
jgi:hypothetical protein